MKNVGLFPIEYDSLILEILLNGEGAEKCMFNALLIIAFLVPLLCLLLFAMLIFTQPKGQTKGQTKGQETSDDFPELTQSYGIIILKDFL